MVLITKGPSALREVPEEYHSKLGRLVTPRHYGPDSAGFPWAADNDCFNGGLDEKGWLEMLNSMQPVVDECLFVAVPDVVADCAATLEAFDHWQPMLRDMGFPLALVAQDGLTSRMTPWERIDSIFIGGSTEWKLSGYAEALMREAKSRGKWVHVGRVNGVFRTRVMSERGADSIDGSSLAMFKEKLLDILSTLDYYETHPTLFD